MLRNIVVQANLIQNWAEEMIDVYGNAASTHALGHFYQISYWWHYFKVKLPQHKCK